MRCLPANPTPWVSDNVIPVLNEDPIDDTDLRMKLYEYLHQHTGEPILADWHEDLVHLLQLLETSPGRAYPSGLILQLVRPDTHLTSLVPHNALSDARGLMRWFQKLLG